MTYEGPSFRDEYILGSDGKPIVDRYGRPVRRRQPQRRPRRDQQATQQSPHNASSSANGPRDPHEFPVQRPAQNPQSPQGPQGPQSPRGPQQGGFDVSNSVDYAARRQNQAGQPYQGPADPIGAAQAQNQQRPQQYIPSEAERARLERQRYEQQRAYNAAPQAPAYQPSNRFLRALDEKRRKPIKLRPAGCMTGAIWLVVIILVLNIAGVFWLDSQLERTQAKSPNQIANTAGTNWLLVGSDSRQGFTDEDADRLGTGGDIGSKRTDTIMVLHIPNTGKATLVSLPRDSYVQVPGYGQDKINAAFTYGGAPLLAQTVEQNTGLRIDHYAEIGMGGLANVVDAVGGIDICPVEGIWDPLAGLDIQAGCQTMDGPTALGYVRTRATGLGDIDRVQRQREFFSALVDKVTTLGTYGNPFRGLPTIKAVAQSFTVGERDHVWNLLRVAVAMRSGVETVTVPYSGFADTEVGSVVVWDQEQSQQLFARLR